MSRAGQLVKNTAIVAIGKVCTKLLAFLLLPFYTAILSTEEYGTVELFNTYISLLVPIVVFQLEDAVFRFVIEVRDEEDKKKQIISTTMLFALVQIGLFFLIFGFVDRWIPIAYKGFFMSNIVVTIFSGLMFQLIRGLGNNFGYAMGSFLTAITNIVLNIILVLVMRMGVDGMFLAIFFSYLVGVLYVVFQEKIYHYISVKAFSWGILKEMLKYSFPLVPNNLCWWILGASDKSIVTYFLGITANGILSVSQKFSTAYTTLYSVFNLTWTENASLHLKDQDSAQYFSFIIEKAFRLLACLCMGIIAGAAVFFPYLVNVKFDEAYYQIPIYMLSSFLYSTIGIFSVVYIAYKKTAKIAKTSFWAAVINLLVNVGLIRFVGLYAASISSVAAYGILLIIRYYDIQKIIKVQIKKKTVFSIGFVMIVNFIIYYMRNNYVSILNLIFIGIYSVFLNREILKECILIIKNRMIKARN